MARGDGLRNGLGTLAAAAFTAVVTELLRREQQARAELAEANARLRGYAAQAEELATTQERNRVARDIHDGLGHHLTVVQMQVQAARAVLPSDPAKADAVLAKAQQQSTEALAEVRRSVAALREPRTMPPLGDALAALAADTSAAGVPTDAARSPAPSAPLPPDVEESLFRAAQEGLTNVRKHAAAGSRPAGARLRRRRHRAAGGPRRRPGDAPEPRERRLRPARAARAGHPARRLGRRGVRARPRDDGAGGGARMSGVPRSACCWSTTRRCSARRWPRCSRCAPEIEVVGEAGDGAEALRPGRRAAAGRRPDGPAHAGARRHRRHPPAPRRAARTSGCSR